MNDQRYYFQSRLALRFLAECRRLAGEKDGPPLIEEVIKTLGRLLQADLFFLASLATAKEPSGLGHTIQPLASLSFKKTAKGYGPLRGKGLGEFTLLSLKHYEKRLEKVPLPLSGKNIRRYLVSERLRILSGQEDGKEPEQRFGDFCLVFAWKEDFSVPSVNEGQLYTTELFSLISEMAAYAINQIISENQYIRHIQELSEIKQTTGSLATFLAAQERATPFQDAETRQEKTNFASNWAVMEVVNQLRPQSIVGLIYFIEMNLKHENMVTKSAVLRVWEWLEWVVENEGSQEDKEKIQALKAKFEEQDETDKKTLKERLRQKIINEYPTIMDA